MSRANLAWATIALLAILFAGCTLPSPTLDPPVTPSDFSQPPNLLSLVSMEGFVTDLHWSPDGTEMLFVHTSDRDSSYTYWQALYRIEVDSKALTQVLEQERDSETGEGFSCPTWTAQGDNILLNTFLVHGTEEASPPNHSGLAILSLDGSRVLPLVNGVGCDTTSSPDGTWLATRMISTRPDAPAPGLYVVRPDGTSLVRLTSDIDSEYYSLDLEWSPDGTEILFVREVREGNREVYVVKVDGSGETNLTRDSSRDFAPAWSPDGTRIAFISDRFWGNRIYVMNADGSEMRLVTRDSAIGLDWSPVSEQIAFIDTESLYVVDSDGKNRRVLVTPPGCRIDEFTWSPNGEWIAFNCVYDDEGQAIAPIHYTTAVYIIRANP